MRWTFRSRNTTLNHAELGSLGYLESFTTLSILGKIKFDNHASKQESSYRGGLDTHENIDADFSLLIINDKTLQHKTQIKANIPSSTPSSAHIFNDHRFTPFTLVDREPVSATSFVLTLHPSTTLPPSEVAAQLAAPWTANDLWSLEVKQPQLQIAREYTPLPNAPPGALRFLVRAINGGEVSTYLSRLPLGATIDLRGPHGSFDLQARLRPEGRLVFLAGGTGIASALQAAHSVLDRTDIPQPDVTILWAVRGRDEIQATQAAAAATAASSRRPWWIPFHAAAPEPELLTPDIASPTQTTRDLLALQSRHPALQVHFFVDADTAPLSPGFLADTLRAAPAASHNDTCALHAQTRHVAVADGGPNAGTRSRFPADGPACACASPPGKNLLLVSGPDGFVAAFAGAKPWRGGGQVQGRVGGVLGELEREGGLLRDWLVLKL
ncbi:Cytochrome c mitochondrial import factor CYC2 like protein [Verticillium longisporum]|uniref:Cytochrome c mitochondrial import factor CYC2 like protein n=1 Tax=Verticillium longisporum TaxID=100787 RepID=A0A8I2ZRV6_VERLO|nr:Cytochrome c mitochondrial import factor CYC2 like protein [Verticillium longisporum]